MADAWGVLNTIRESQRTAAVQLPASGIELQDVSQEALAGGGGYTPKASTGADLRELPKSPADPRWRMRMPPPACVRCNNDHKPNQYYDHPVDTGDPQEAPMQPVVNGFAGGTNGSAPHPATPSYRVAIYDSRTGYVVKVESAPDWDDVFKTKLDGQQLTALLPILRALGVKIKNNSEDEFEDGKLAEDRAPAVRVPPTRSAEDVRAEWAELLGTEPPSLRATGDGSSDGENPTGLAPGAAGGATDAAGG